MNAQCIVLAQALRTARRFVCCNNNFTESVRREALAEIDAALATAKENARGC